MKKKSADLNLVTKDYLDETLDIRLSLFEDKIVRRIEDAITKSHSDLYTRIDPLISELENNREDRELTTQLLRNLDKRVTKLETPN